MCIQLPFVETSPQYGKQKLLFLQCCQRCGSFVCCITGHSVFLLISAGWVNLPLACLLVVHSHKGKVQPRTGHEGPEEE